MPGGYAPAVNPNKKLYNAGSEWQNDIDGLADYYSTYYREYDPVIGRFNGVDPMLDADVSVFSYAGNCPINYNDPLGNRKLSSFRDEQELMDYISVMGTNNIDDWNFQSYVQNLYTYLEGGGGNYEALVKGSEFSFLYNLLVEKEVKDKIIKGQKQKVINPNAISEWQQYYFEAVQIITRAYPIELDMALINQYTENGYDFVEGEVFHTPQIDKRKTTGKYTIDAMLFGLEAFDKFANGDSYWNFGELTRTIYHEFIHVYTVFGLKGFTQLQGSEYTAEAEFIAYFSMHEPNNLPAATSYNIASDYEYGLNYLFLGPPDKPEPVSKARRELYKKEVTQMYMFIFSYIYGFDD